MNPMTDRPSPTAPPATDADADFGSLMQRGEQLHLSGATEQALTLFEHALALRPQDIQAASACASVLVELQRSQAAWSLLYERRDALLADADGACNLAIMAESCGQPGQARAAYDRALELDPSHLRSLNNRGLLAGRERRWTDAVRDLSVAVAALPGEFALRINLVDMLTGAREYGIAVREVDNALKTFGAQPALSARRAVLLAFGGEFEASRAAFSGLDDDARTLLDGLLAHASKSGRGRVIPGNAAVSDEYELFAARGFDALQECDWRAEATLADVLRRMVERVRANGEARDWRDAQFYALMLPLTEHEQTQVRTVAGDSIAGAAKSITPFNPTRRAASADQRLRIGISAQTLADERYRNALERQLALHDRSRFAFFVYSPTPQPQASQSETLRQLAENVVEIGHLTHLETAMRIRLDRLDLWMDTAFNTPWCRADLPAMRVAPLQMRSQTWQRVHLPMLYDYSFGDAFTHPDMAEQDYGAVVRLPASCWLAANDDAPGAPVTRAAAGLADDAVVLASFVPTISIDPQTFAAWMDILRAVPKAVLWLPAYGQAAKSNLRREAASAGIPPERLVFLNRMERPGLLSHLALADLFLDAFRFNANHGLADALRLGVPAVSCAGQNMASRLGGSMLTAAGLADCVVDDPAAYVGKAVSLAADPGPLQALRRRLASARTTEPFFDTTARVRDWEAAWTRMVERQRQGLAPQAFDLAL
ncbi:MAG: glycosyltransferase family 41 protein [Comamonadaceae bacterium]|nr:MAG: glycosyltransferase family 41 protein [Comamonadaceae bacterium]